MPEVRNRYVYGLPYELADPVFGGKPCYIGVGTKRRMFDHARCIGWTRRPRHNAPLYSYISECAHRGVRLDPYVIANDLTLEEALALEIEIINQFGRLDIGTGCLLNACAGGFGSRNPAPATRAKNSARMKGKPSPMRGRKMPPDVVARHAAAMRGRRASPESRARMSKAQTGKKMSPEAIEKTASALRGRKRHPSVVQKVSTALMGKERDAKAVEATALWHRGRKRAASVGKNISAALSGKPKSDDHKTKIAVALTGKVRSAESRANQSAATKGRPKSPETRQKMRIAALKREERKRSDIA